MIKRYSRPEMSAIWEDKTRFDTYLTIECLAAEAFCHLGVIPSEDVKKIWDHASYDINRIEEIERETRHDVIAFTRAVSETLGDERKWIHYGLTSTDVVDTANGALFKKANEIIRQDLMEFIQVLKTQAIKYQNTPCIGRTHGVHADITSFGLKWALWYDEMQRNLTRFNHAAQGVEVGKISGAVGNFANTPPFVQDYVCEKLGIASAKISTQVLQRDRHADYFSTLALIGSSLEKIAVEIRHLQRTEVREVEESFRSGQKGSSAMPHKRNPISSENISGCARILRGYMIASFENIPLWHERDISHSSAERIMMGDATILLDYMLSRYKDTLANLTVFEERMIQNIQLTYGVIFSQRVMTKLIEKGLSRENAYDIIQKMAQTSWLEHKPFLDLLAENETIKSILTMSDIESCFTLEYYLKEVQTIFKRVGIN